MDTNINYTVVGIFVIGLLTAVILAIIWLSSGFNFEQYTTYLVHMQESVSGLSIDSSVEYNGVSVGTVKSIELDQNNPHLVEVLLNIKDSTPITQATYATLTTKGLTGVVYVALKDSGRDLRPLLAVKGERYPVIKTAPSIFMRLDTALSQLSNNLKQVAESISTVLDKDNQRSIKLTLQNLADVTGALATNSKKLDAILSNTAKATQQFAPLMQSSMGAMRILEMQTLPATYRMLTNLDTLTRNLSEVSTEIKQNPAVLIRGVKQTNLGPGE